MGLTVFFYDWKHARAKLNLQKENCHMRPAKRLPLQRLNLRNSTIMQFKVTQVLVHQSVTIAPSEFPLPFVSVNNTVKKLTPT